MSIDKHKRNDLQKNHIKSDQIAFIKDTNFNYLLSKTEKICTAIYMIASLWDKSESLKRQIKDKTLSFFSSIVTLISSTGSEERFINANTAGLKAIEVKSLFILAYRSGIVSEMNYQILNSEIDNLLDLLGEIKSANEGTTDNIFSSEFFAVNPVRNEVIDEKAIIKDRLDKSIKDSNYNSIIKDIYKGHSINNVLYKTPKGQVSKKRIDNSNSERRSKILDIIKDKKEVSVKDIAIKIPTVSEKTLQRELLSMVRDKLIKKEGERRWSKYSLI